MIVVLVIIVYRRGSTGAVCLPEGGWICVTVAAAVTSAGRERAPRDRTFDPPGSLVPLYNLPPG